MRATAIIPVKRFSQTNQRLLGEIDPRARALLAGSMLSDVLAAVARARRIERTIVVTGEGRAERIALEASKRLRRPLEVLQDPVDQGHSEAATLGIVRAKATGAGCVALLPIDCPLLDPSELDGALDAQPDSGVGVIPDRHGSGTNGLILSPADAIRPAFGADSRRIHLERAEARGLAGAVRELPSMALDLDTPDDLEALRGELEADPERAPQTAEALLRIAAGPDAKRARRRPR
ncbi:2-phospho-L-lactate guanylyltransferase [Thermoleophilia bacterium SCSIO 60948]|nr:2-phospho-L-lactate guanylyltransferase [Thermoleophilia bacterium SCSIO 60948]